MVVNKPTSKALLRVQSQPFLTDHRPLLWKRLHWGQSKETSLQNLDGELSRSILRKFDGAVFALGSLFDEEVVHVVNQAQCVLTILYLGSRSFRACSYSYKGTLRGSYVPHPP